MKLFILTIKITMWLMLCGTALAACSDEDLSSMKENNQGSPIQLIVSGPKNGISSRMLKQEFNNEDGIHISTSFILDNDARKTVYSFLKYKDGKWIETNTSTFNWPWNAVEASFTAYYIPAVKNYQNGSKLNAGGQVNISLSELSQNDVEPLKATYTKVKAGSSVYLQFDHLFSKVTFTEINKQKNDNVTPGEELRLIIPQTENNWRITLDGNELKEKTWSDTDEYIANNCTKAISDNDPTTNVTFLIPAVSQDKKMKLARRDMSTLHFISLPETATNGLEVGKHYKIDVNTLLDNYISGEITESEWNDNIDAIKLTTKEIGDYLIGVSTGKAFSVIRNDKTIPILIMYTNNDGKPIVSQIRDVDFQWFEFTPPAVINNNVIFNGNNHYIKNVSLKNATRAPGDNELNKAIFAGNKGKLSNLIIENIKIDASSTTKETRLGTFIGTNESEGEMTNINIKGQIELITSPEIIYAGALVGLNYGNLTNCSVKADALTIKVVKETAESTINIGGLVGYTSGEGKEIKNCLVEVGDNSSITITGNTTKNIFVGGFTGQNMNVAIQDCRTNLPLHISKAPNFSVGGFIGITSFATLQGCTSTGTITCEGNTGTTDVAIGGFIGILQNATLIDCAAVSNITGTFENQTNAGGFAGKIEAKVANVTIQYSSATGKLADNVAGMIGVPSIEKNYTITINNSFCINGTVFSKSIDNITITSCHFNGNNLENETGFNPNGNTWWTNTPPIYGEDIYYLKRGYKITK